MRFLKKIRLLALLLGCFLTFAQPGYAYQWGAVELKPVVSVKESYDSNVTAAHSNKLDDFITMLSFGLEGAYEGKNKTASVKGALNEELFAQNDDFNNFSQDLSGIFKQDFSKHDHLTIKNSFLHDEKVTSFLDEFGRTSGRYDFYKNTFGIAFAHDYSDQLTAQWKFDQEYYNPRRADLTESIQNKLGTQINYAVTSKTIPFVFYDYSKRGYDPGGTVERNAVGLGLKHYLTTQLYLDGKVGADYISPIGGDNKVRPQYSVGLTDEVDETTMYGMSYLKQYSDSSYDQDLFDSWRFMLNWGKYLAERLKVTVSGFTGGGKFEQQGIKDTLNGAGVGLNYEATKNAMLGLGFIFSKTDSNAVSRDYEKEVVTMSVSIKF